MDDEVLVVLGALVILTMLVYISVAAFLAKRATQTAGFMTVIVSTLIAPFANLFVLKVLSKLYWFLTSTGEAGCAGGECGPGQMASGYWPILIFYQLPVAFVVSMLVIWRIRKRNA